MNSSLNNVIFRRFYFKNSGNDLEKALRSVKINPILFVL